MKRLFFISSIICSVCLLSACGGDHNSTSDHGDTVDSKYPPVVDSSKFDQDTGRNIPGMHGDTLKKDTTMK
ncbi:MAG TPA: hypothetical protein VHA56_06090 [Mucilaginibacter sp.]|nr:hypothetical protein [Mucilaginibacter sp.]